MQLSVQWSVHCQQGPNSTASTGITDIADIADFKAGTAGTVTTAITTAAKATSERGNWICVRQQLIPIKEIRF